MLPTKANESPPGVVNSASLGEQNAQSQGYPCSRFEEPGGFFIHLSIFFPSDWCVSKKSGLDLAELCPQTHLKCLVIFGGYSPETNAANHHLNRDVLVKSWCRSSVMKVRFYMIRLAPDTLQGFPVGLLRSDLKNAGHVPLLSRWHWIGSPSGNSRWPGFSSLFLMESAPVPGVPRGHGAQHVMCGHIIFAIYNMIL